MHLEGQQILELSPMTPKKETAEKWLTRGWTGIDGVMAKRRDLTYRSGERTGMLKVKRMRTADCVVGGFRYASRGPVIGSLLLGLYDEAGRLHHVGFCSSFSDVQRLELAEELQPLIEPPGFTGRAPGAPSRWSTDRSTKWHPLKPITVVEVQYDHFAGDRFRHGTRFLRFRPDKDPRSCTLDQIQPGSSREAAGLTETPFRAAA
jgi:ATP-dependent DNA ligase